MMHQDIQTNANWLVVGAAPDTGELFDVAHTWASRCNASEIATNAAWQLFATLRAGVRSVPDYYWISDAVACKLHGRAVKWMHSLGTKIVTLSRTEYGLRERDLSDVDAALLDLPNCGPQVPTFVDGQWHHPRLSGLISLQIAAHHLPPREQGCTVVLIGMTGYRSSEAQIVADTIDGRMGKAAGVDHTSEWIKPYTQSVVDFHRDVTFIVAGKPRFELTGPNVVIAPTPQDLANALQARN